MRCGSLDRKRTVDREQQLLIKLLMPYFKCRLCAAAGLLLFSHSQSDYGEAGDRLFPVCRGFCVRYPLADQSFALFCAAAGFLLLFSCRESTTSNVASAVQL